MKETYTVGPKCEMGSALEYFRTIVEQEGATVTIILSLDSTQVNESTASYREIRLDQGLGIKGFSEVTIEVSKPLPKVVTEFLSRKLELNRFDYSY